MQIKPEVALGGLAAAVFGPVHTRGDQLDGRGIDHVDRVLESIGQTCAAASGAEAWLNGPKLIEHAPEQLLGHSGVPDLVGMGETFATWRGRSTNPRQPPAVMAQTVAYVIETDGAGQLTVEPHGDHVVPRAERPCLGVHPKASGPVFQPDAPG